MYWEEDEGTTRRWRHTIYFYQIGILLIQDHIKFSLVWLLADYPVVGHSFYDDFFIFIHPEEKKYIILAGNVSFTTTQCLSEVKLLRLCNCHVRPKQNFCVYSDKDHILLFLNIYGHKTQQLILKQQEMLWNTVSIISLEEEVFPWHDRMSTTNRTKEEFPVPLNYQIIHTNETLLLNPWKWLKLDISSWRFPFSNRVWRKCMWS